MRPQEQPGCHTKRTGQCRNPQRRKESIHTGLNKYGSEDSQQSPDGGPPIDLIKSHSQRYSSKHRTKAEQTVGDIPTVTLIQNGNGQCQGRSDSSPNGSPIVADRQSDQKQQSAVTTTSSISVISSSIVTFSSFSPFQATSFVFIPTKEKTRITAETRPR